MKYKIYFSHNEDGNDAGIIMGNTVSKKIVIYFVR